MKEEIFIIGKGSLALTLERRNKEEITLELLQSGTTLGLYGVFDKRRAIYNVKVESNRAMILIIKKQDLLECLEKSKLSSIVTEIHNNKRLDYAQCPST